MRRRQCGRAPGRRPGSATRRPSGSGACRTTPVRPGWSRRAAACRSAAAPACARRAPAWPASAGPMLSARAGGRAATAQAMIEVIKVTPAGSPTVIPMLEPCHRNSATIPPSARAHAKSAADQITALLRMINPVYCRRGDTPCCELPCCEPCVVRHRVLPPRLPRYVNCSAGRAAAAIPSRSVNVFARAAKMRSRYSLDELLAAYLSAHRTMINGSALWRMRAASSAPASLVPAPALLLSGPCNPAARARADA